jgi:hypothetical protein
MKCIFVMAALALPAIVRHPSQVKSISASSLRVLSSLRGPVSRRKIELYLSICDLTTMDTRRASVFAGISVAQAGLVIAMVFAATAMARGLGYSAGADLLRTSTFGTIWEKIAP